MKTRSTRFRVAPCSRRSQVQSHWPRCLDSPAVGQTVSQRRMPRIIVFDVNETLLDVDALSHTSRARSATELVLREWSSTVLLYSEVASLAGPYSDFGAIGGAALEMVASSRRVSLSTDDRTRILSGMRSLPAHPDVREGLRRLREAGFRT